MKNFIKKILSAGKKRSKKKNQKTPRIKLEKKNCYFLYNSRQYMSACWLHSVYSIYLLSDFAEYITIPLFTRKDFKSILRKRWINKSGKNEKEFDYYYNYSVLPLIRVIKKSRKMKAFQQISDSRDIHLSLHECKKRYFYSRDVPMKGLKGKAGYIETATSLISNILALSNGEKFRIKRTQHSNKKIKKNYTISELKKERLVGILDKTIIVFMYSIPSRGLKAFPFQIKIYDDRKKLKKVFELAGSTITAYTSDFKFGHTIGSMYSCGKKQYIYDNENNDGAFLKKKWNSYSFSYKSYGDTKENFILFDYKNNKNMFWCPVYYEKSIYEFNKKKYKNLF